MVPNDTAVRLEGDIGIYGGIPPYSAAVTSGTAPAGISFYVEGNSVLADGVCTATDTYSWTITVTSSNGVTASVPLTAEMEEGDPHWDKVVFFAPFTEDIEDKSSREIAITNNGSCTIDSADGAVGLGCLSTPTLGALTAAVDAKFGSQDFTVEFFLKTTARSPAWWGAISVEGLIGMDFELFVLTCRDMAASSGAAWNSSNGSNWNVWLDVNAGAMNDGNWNHWAFVRNGTALRLYRNGTMVVNTTIAAGLTYNQRGPYLTVGAKQGTPASGAESKFQHVRLTKGIARYTSDFTVPTKFLAR